MPLAAGARVGPYEILAALEAGGMDEVHKARTFLAFVVELRRPAEQPAHPFRLH